MYYKHEGRDQQATAAAGRSKLLLNFRYMRHRHNTIPGWLTNHSTIAIMIGIGTLKSPCVALYKVFHSRIRTIRVR